MNEQFLIEIGFISNIDEFRERFGDANIDQEVQKWTDSIKNFDTIFKSMGTNIQSELGDLSKFQSRTQLFEAFTKALSDAGVQFTKLNQHAIEFRESLSNIAYEYQRITSSGSILSGQNLSDFGKQQGYGSVSEGLADITKLSSVSGEALGSNKTLKENLKLQYLEPLRELTELTDKELTKLKDNIANSLSTVVVEWDNNGNAIKQRLQIQLDSYRTYSVDLERIQKEINGRNEVFWSRTDQSTSYNASKELADEVKQIEALMTAYVKLANEQEKLKATQYTDENTAQLKLNEQALASLTEQMTKYGLSVDESSGKITITFAELSQNVQQSDSAIEKLTQTNDKLNQSLAETQAKAKDKTLSTEINQLVKDYQALAQAQIQLEKLTYAGAKSEDIVAQKNAVAQLTQKISQYSQEAQQSERATKAMEDASRKLTDEQARLENNVNRTGISFGSLAQRLKETAQNTLAYSSTYKIFNALDTAVKSSISKIHELDIAMYNIRIVTGDTQEATQKLVGTYADLAIQLGSTTTAIAEGAVGWLKL